MDRFTRNYSIFLGLLAAGLLLAWIVSLDPRVGAINGRLRDDPLLAAYPYRFELRSLDRGTAEVTSPRSPQVPATRFLRVLHPDLAGRPGDDPAMTAAQRELAGVQARVRALVLSAAGVERLRWVVDRDWYARHGIPLN